MSSQDVEGTENLLPIRSLKPHFLFHIYGAKFSRHQHARLSGNETWI